MTKTKLPLLLFVLTCASTTYAGGLIAHGPAELADWQPFVLGGLRFSVPLMAILLAHEFGHYIAARIHRVPASLPHFIPFPFSLIGTFGAIILMPDRIERRNALFDIGAAGPLAGFVVTLPVLVLGLANSEVGPLSTEPYLQEGHSLLYAGMLRWVKGPMPTGHDIHLSPMGLAGWGGLWLTMINLIPSVQLDGGHVAYALWGERQQRISLLVRRALPAFGALVSVYYLGKALLEGKAWDTLYAPLTAGLPWIVWSLILRVIANQQEAEHPPTDDHVLSPVRTWLARGTLLLFVLLFMPSWMHQVIP